MRKCPYCAEGIEGGLTGCPFCHEAVQNDLTEKPDEVNLRGGDAEPEPTDASRVSPSVAPAPRSAPAGRARKRWLLLAAVGAGGIFVYFFLGLYSIQPIGVLPEGQTWVVWRSGDEPFFNSADGLCLRRTGGVSLLTRGLALAQAPKDRIVVRLPYMDFAYLLSTGGTRFDR